MPVCSLTGSSVVDFNGIVHSIPDRCVYSLVKPQGSSSFELLAGFQERRLLGVPFLDYLKLSLQKPDVTFLLEQGGRVQVRRKQMLASSRLLKGAQEFVLEHCSVKTVALCHWGSVPLVCQCRSMAAPSAWTVQLRCFTVWRSPWTSKQCQPNSHSPTSRSLLTAPQLRCQVRIAASGLSACSADCFVLNVLLKSSRTRTIGTTWGPVWQPLELHPNKKPECSELLLWQCCSVTEPNWLSHSFQEHHSTVCFLTLSAVCRPPAVEFSITPAT